MMQQANLSKELIEEMQGLIRVNLDASEGMATAAKTVESKPLADLMSMLSKERREQAGELQRCVEAGGEEPVSSGSTKGMLHRWWLNCRGALNGGDDHVVLVEAERGEDEIKERYEEALKTVPGSPMEPVLREQYEKVKAAHDAIRDLRDM